MKTIWKFPISPVGVIELVMPAFAEILSVQFQRGELQLWALVEPELPKETRVIRCYGTGHSIREHDLVYISTIQLEEGALVLHFFEQT